MKAWLGIVYSAVLATSLCACAGDAERDRLRTVIGSALRDPASAQYRNDRLVRHADGRVYYCGEINARNAFGGYVGFRQFMASSDAATISNPDDSDRVREAFAKFWKLNCSGK